jgi:MSHA biogenesis protein MshJ
MTQQMKRNWNKVVQKIDGLSLRERVVVFVMAALILATLVNSLALDPLFEKQKQLTQRLKQEQSQIAGIQVEIQQKVKAQADDPDASNRSRLQALLKQSGDMQMALRDMQKGLVSPDKMVELLDGILKRNGALRLVSLKKLPASNLNDSVASSNARNTPEKTGEAPPSAGKKAAVPILDAVYKHGVEITVQGSYLEMMSYMAELESMPWQLLWATVRLNVDEYPKASLTLTLFTLSLDKKWLNL